MTNTVKVGDGEVTITLDMSPTDISTATALKIKYRKPDGSKSEWTATRVGVTNSITYTIPKTFFTLPGAYKVNAYAEFTTAAPHTGDDVFFIVESV
jgi:hypothetical protein